VNTPSNPPSRQPLPKTILLVEDDKSTLMVLRKMLQQEGYRVLSANGGEEGLTIATQQQHLDLLVTDVIMPKLNGTDLVKRVRASRPDLPVLFISGLMQAAGVLGGQHRNEAFLSKPIVQEHLATKVQRLLRGFE
jgi:two-component system, cell cycle sensor histidine kinase and response regulator CckA